MRHPIHLNDAVGIRSSCHSTRCRFLKRKRMLSNMLTKDWTATVVWPGSVPWLDLVGLESALWELACGNRLVGVDSWEWIGEHYIMAVGSWALICGTRVVEPFVEVGQELRKYQIPLLEICFIVLSVGYRCNATQRGPKHFWRAD